MNVYKSDKKRKFFPIIISILVVSIVLNVVLSWNLVTQQKEIKAQQETKLKEKEDTILSLQEEVDGLKSYINSSTPQNKKESSKTELEKQQKYKNVANEFINAYLNYDTNTLKERREKLLEISTEELVNRVTPKETNKDPGKALSSDPTFTSQIDKIKIYTTGTNDESNSSEILVDVNYIAKGSEGESTVRTFIYLKLQSNANGAIKVIDFMYYPIS